MRPSLCSSRYSVAPIVRTIANTYISIESKVNNQKSDNIESVIMFAMTRSSDRKRTTLMSRNMRNIRRIFKSRPVDPMLWRFEVPDALEVDSTMTEMTERQTRTESITAHMRWEGAQKLLPRPTIRNTSSKAKTALQTYSKTFMTISWSRPLASHCTSKPMMSAFATKKVPMKRSKRSLSTSFRTEDTPLAGPSAVSPEEQLVLRTVAMLCISALRRCVPNSLRSRESSSTHSCRVVRLDVSATAVKVDLLVAWVSCRASCGGASVAAVCFPAVAGTTPDIVDSQRRLLSASLC
mmetsp:Transcript_4408/g.14124  ORF Transcript_4408/g.14124 Transcript_4408/m.14124 type:complete len:294 (+) Transcript_4408:699-1580(+)